MLGMSSVTTRITETHTMRHFMQRTQLWFHIPMLLLAFLFLAPMIWMISTAFKSPEDLIQGLGALRWFPNPVTFENFVEVLGKVEEFPIWRWTSNSVFISLAATALVLTVDSLAARSEERRVGK